MHARPGALCVVLFALAARSSAIPSAPAPSSWAAPSDAFPTLTIGTTAGFGPTGYGKSASGTMGLQRDVWSGVLVAAGSEPASAGPPDLCTNTMSMAAPGGTPGFGDPGLLERTAAYWNIEARLVSAEADVVTFDLRWSRVVNDTTLTPDENRSEEARLSMHEGVSGVLDLVRRPGPSVRGCESFAVTLAVGFSGPADVADAAIAYDLWHVERDRYGRTSADRFRTAARQGAAADFFFRPRYYADDGRLMDRASSLEVNLSGSIRGRVRHDGLIDLTIDGWWGVRHSGGGTGTGGRKLITVRPGETVEVELPRNGARVSSISDVAPFAGGAQTGLRVTVRRLW